MSNEDEQLTGQSGGVSIAEDDQRRWVEPGVLYVVATPIGNLADFSSRAVAVLRGVDVIACEDTRHARKLLSHFGIATSVLSVHEHNEAARSVQIVERLQAGQSVALVSDAGTPAISDPGQRLVRQVRDAGLRVSPIPGPAAVIAALSAGGLPTDHFWFEGFLPAKSAARRARLGGLTDLPSTLAFYEAPHRIVAMIRDLAAAFGPERPAVLARELSKRFEQFESGSLQELLEALETEAVPARGEFVVLVAGADPVKTGAAEEAVAAANLIDALLTEGVSAKTTARVVARLTQRSRNQVYQDVLGRKASSD